MSDLKSMPGLQRIDALLSLPLAALLLVTVPIWAPGCRTGDLAERYDRTTLEFRLVRAGSTRAANRNHQSELVQIGTLPGGVAGKGVRELVRKVEGRLRLEAGSLFLYRRPGARLSRFLVLGPALLDCRHLQRVHRSRSFTSFEIRLTLNKAGAERLYEVTAVNEGEALAIVWRGRVVAAPTIQQAIPDGRALITGIRSRHVSGRIEAIVRRCIPETRP